MDLTFKRRGEGEQKDGPLILSSFLIGPLDYQCNSSGISGAPTPFPSRPINHACFLNDRSKGRPNFTLFFHPKHLLETAAWNFKNYESASGKLAGKFEEKGINLLAWKWNNFDAFILEKKSNFEEKKKIIIDPKRINPTVKMEGKNKLGIFY